MRSPWIERVVGAGLLLGPLAYALTLTPRVIERVEIVEVEVPAAAEVEAGPVIPVQPPAVEAPVAPVAEAPPVASPEEPGDRIPFAFVSDAGLVLSTEAQAQWGKGRLRGHAGSGMFRAAKKADGNKVPRELWAQRGRTFDLYDDSGKRCTVALGDLWVLGQHNGPDHYALFDDGEHELDYDEIEARTFTRKEIRTQVWSWAESSGGAWLVADMIGAEDCGAVMWGRDSTLPAPVVLQYSDEPTELTAKRLAQHESSDVLAQTKKDYEQWYSELSSDEREYETPWSQVAAENPATVTSWLDDTGAERLLELRFGHDSSSCGDGYDGSVNAFDRVTPDGWESTELAVGPEAVLDVDLDGKFELIYANDEDGLVLEGETVTDSLFIEQAFECPC